MCIRDRLKAKLRAIQLPLVERDGDTGKRSVCAYDFLAAAAAVLLEHDPKAAAPEMPESWPAAPGGPLILALHQAMTARMAALTAKSGRFDDPKARYVLRAFVRARCSETGCTRLFWSDETEPFVIAPWYEGSGAPPVRITLPDPSDKAMLKALKPNVAFVVPPAMQNLLGGKAKDLMDGKGNTLGLDLAWICGFNIPLITICAFLVLNVFFSLFSLVFGWLPFFKICLPAPKLGPKPPQP
jgi:hypothetical protein